MFELDGKCTISIDLAALSKNLTGIALLKGEEAETSPVYTDEEILRYITRNAPLLIAMDAPLSLPKKGKTLRKADREMVKKKGTVYSLQLSPR